MTTRVPSWRMNFGIIGMLGLCFAGAASAQVLGPTVEGNTEPVLGETSKLRLGISLAPMPVGTLKGSSTSVDAAFAFALAPVADYSINQFFFVGFAPQVIFNVNGKDSKGDSGKELDLRVRVGGNARVADKIQLFAYLAPGYSVLFFPNTGDAANPKGLVFAFAGGALMDSTPAVFLSGELGYQVGYQSSSGSDSKTNYLHIGVGLGLRL